MAETLGATGRQVQIQLSCTLTSTVACCSIRPMSLLYEQVAAHVESMIERGSLRPGDRLPSVRKLSRQRRVSVATVVEAYRHLEDRGRIEARPQSGHYVRRAPRPAAPEPRPPRPVASPATVRFGQRIQALYRAVRDPSIVPLGCATIAP